MAISFEQLKERHTIPWHIHTPCVARYTFHPDAWAGLTLTSTWCLLGTFRAFGLLKSKKKSQFFNLRGLIAVGRLPTAKRLKKRGFIYDIYANLTVFVVTIWHVISSYKYTGSTLTPGQFLLRFNT